MANDEDLARLRQGVDVWNAWRAQNPEPRVDLSRADLSWAKLRRADLSRADLREANLVDADLQGADLRDATLRGANLGITIDILPPGLAAKLAGADLCGADLRMVDLIGANLRGTILSGADLFGTFLFDTVFANVDLSTTKSLDSCIHHGPSVLDHRTLQRSGRLPLEFLRGCGLPDRLIDYLPSLLEEAIQYYSCFISYSSKDEAFAQRLYADLQNKGVRCWFAPENMKIGDKFRQFTFTNGCC